jgi:uncharacterized protein DUF29
MTEMGYEGDYYAWLTEQAALLRARCGEALDYDNLAEELEDMGRSERRAVESYLTIALLHLLKWHVQPALRSKSWRRSVQYARRAIAKRLAESPSLRPRLPELLASAYLEARFRAALEADRPETGLPETCPWGLAHVLDLDFFPEP